MHVHAPWALAVNARIRERLGVEGSAVASDDGIIARVPDTEAERKLITAMMAAKNEFFSQ